tara:strand:+ start:338 stop:499 length:162 start_codon:yes stop_codon:yes gene_type:complete
MTKLIDITHLLRPLERREYWLKKFREETHKNSEKMTPKEFKKWKEKEMKRRDI